MLTVLAVAGGVTFGRTGKRAAFSKRRTATIWRKHLNGSLPAKDVGINLSSIVLGGLMLMVFGCIVFTIIQQTWNSMAILIVLEVFLVLITAGTGVIEGVLQMASESLGSFMRS